MPSAFPESSIPIIQARRQASLIKQEYKSRQKWVQRNEAFMRQLHEENVALYGEKRHPIDVRLEAQNIAQDYASNRINLARRPLAKSSEPWVSDPDANRYYGYGIAPPGTKRDWEMQVARGAFDGKFEKSINAMGAGKSKYGKLTTEKSWMDYSGVRIFGKGHKDPLANDYTRFRSTPRALQRDVPEDYAPPKGAGDDDDLLSEVEVPSQPTGRLFKSRKGALVDKYTDKTFDVSPLTTKLPEDDQISISGHSTARSHVSRPHSSASSVRSATRQQNGRWKVPNRPGTAAAEASSRERLQNLLELRRRKFMETQQDDAASVASSRKSASIRVTPRVEKTQDGRWVVKYEKKEGSVASKARGASPVPSLQLNAGARPASRANSTSSVRSTRSRASSAAGGRREGLQLAHQDDEVSLRTDASW